MLNDFFTKEEIDLLKSSFEYVFRYIADSDDKADKKENNAFKTFVGKYKYLTSSLSIELLSNYDIESVRDSSKNSNSIKVNLKNIGMLLDSKLDRDESVEFKQNLIAFGYYIANASGSFFDHKVSHDEEDALNEIGYAIGISVKDLISSGELNTILKRLE